MVQNWKDYTNEELFSHYRRTQSIECKQELSVRYLPIVRSIAIQMRNVYVSYFEIEDIVNDGVIELLKAIDRYNPDMNATFETYISKRLRGMIIDVARKHDWVSRADRKGYSIIMRASEEYYQTHGENPSIFKLTELTGYDESECMDIMSKSNMMSIVSLDKTLENAGEHSRVLFEASSSKTKDPSQKFDESAQKEDLMQAIETLNEQERLVISLYYNDELNMTQISRVLKISSARVSQVHSRAINKLKEQLTSK